ncbi:glycosyltransferase family 2 protein [Pontibacter locisalis]|uniref:Glycosyltransferase family 2 protein n=1 Tax=Pontibacter locisalis TaxID=1719035 RepID=A0ABW5IPY3_9BACT
MKSSAAHKVSIITCFLNIEPYLEETINSVLQQDYEQWELLLIDDGSTDGSTEIAKTFASHYAEKIVYLEHPGHINRGSSASRNLGLEKATGSFIAFIDADDVWLPSYLSIQVKLIHQYPAAMVCQATEYWYSWENPQKKNIVIPVGAKQDHLHLPPQLSLSLYPLGQGAAPCICGMLIKKEVIDRLGGFDESFMGMYDEQVLLSRLYLQEPVFLSSLCLNRYRQRPGSLVHSSQESDYHQVRKRFLEWFEEYLYSHNDSSPAVVRQLEKALLPYRKPFLYFVKSLSAQNTGHKIRKGMKKLRKKVKKYSTDISRRFS